MVAFNSHSNTLSRNDPTLMKKNERSERSNKDYIPNKGGPDLNPGLFGLKTMCFPLFFQRRCSRRLATNVGRKCVLILIHIAKVLSKKGVRLLGFEFEFQLYYSLAVYHSLSMPWFPHLQNGFIVP